MAAIVKTDKVIGHFLLQLFDWRSIPEMAVARVLNCKGNVVAMTRYSQLHRIASWPFQSSTC